MRRVGLVVIVLLAARTAWLSPAWAGLVAGMAASAPARLAPVAGAVLAALALASTWGVRQHLAPWQAAGAARDAVLAAQHFASE